MMKFEDFFGKRLCVAVSGGVDSTALLHYLKALEKDCGFCLSAVHCEHGIRGEESKEDMRFVQALCEAWDVPLFTFAEDCPARAKREKQSLETAAREFRRECFSALTDTERVDYIVTAHHAQDEAETVLFRLARGSALSGARGMKVQEGRLLRPFLHWGKDKILAYAKEHGLSWREDKTNFERDATRNKLRWTVLPALEAAVHGAAENLVRFATLAGEDDALLYRLSEELREKREEGWFVRESDEAPLFKRACLASMKALGLEQDYAAVHLNALFALQKSERGARLDLPKNLRAERLEKGVLLFVQKADFAEDEAPTCMEENFNESGFDGGRYAVKLFFSPPKAEGEAWKVLRADADKIPKNAVFRFRREGDTIEKFGGGRQTLKKFFNDKKVPPKERAFIPLLAEFGGGEVLAVCGVEISERIKVSETTQRVVYIILQKK